MISFTIILKMEIALFMYYYVLWVILKMKFYD